jgi:hypothetical protein
MSAAAVGIARHFYSPRTGTAAGFALTMAIASASCACEGCWPGWLMVNTDAIGQGWLRHPVHTRKELFPIPAARASDFTCMSPRHVLGLIPIWQLNLYTPDSRYIMKGKSAPKNPTVDITQTMSGQNTKPLSFSFLGSITYVSTLLI